jgi:hypothetical protein
MKIEQLEKQQPDVKIELTSKEAHCICEFFGHLSCSTVKYVFGDGIPDKTIMFTDILTNDIFKSLSEKGYE